MNDLALAQRQMIEQQLARRGIRDGRVLDAFRAVPREAFVSQEQVAQAYDDGPLPLEEGQSISQPFIVALTAQALGLRGDERVLEVGTGSGYAAAILGCLVPEVFTIERLPALAGSASERLTRLGFFNVRVTVGDGSLGWPEHAPYQAIAVAAGGPCAPAALLEQLSPGGRLVMPIGPTLTSQQLFRITRTGPGDYRSETLSDVRFVPLIGAQGFAAPPPSAP